MRQTTAMLLALLTLGLAAPTSAQMTWPDRQLFDQIAGQVERYTQYTIFDSVSALVDDGHVTLAGWVTQPHKRDDIERRVRTLTGVRSIENDIQVLPASVADDRLRFRIAKAIYGNASFWHLAALPNPPIKIIVRDGTVTLDGVVGTNVERMLARSLASGQGASGVSNQLRIDAEIREALAVADPE